MESAALPADPSGCLFADWIARRGCAKSTAYKWRAELGITPEKRRKGSAVEVWLSAADEALLEAYSEALGRGLTTREALTAVGRPAPMESIGQGALVPMESDGQEALVPVDSDGQGALVPVDSTGQGALVPMESDGTAEADPMESDGPPPADPMESDGLQHLRRRLAALRDAVDLGAPLSTAEVALLLGARPGGAEVVRGRLRAVRQARNVWTIEPD
jgi:hypothetical protein